MGSKYDGDLANGFIIIRTLTFNSKRYFKLAVNSFLNVLVKCIYIATAQLYTMVHL